MKRIAGLLVATSQLGLAAHAGAESPAKQATKRGAVAPSGAQLKRVESLGGALGGTPPPKATPAILFNYADADHDGAVSFGEFATLANESFLRRVEKRFKKLDRNHDGRCTRAEVNKMSPARFSRFDLDQNGYFTRSELVVVLQRELAARLEQAYARLDSNHDGRFSVAELTPPAPVERKLAGTGRRLEVAQRKQGSTY